MSGTGSQVTGSEAGDRAMVYVPAGGLSAGFTEKESTDA